MSNNWGDYNGDGHTDYVDYKIFTTQVDPYSGEYQGDAYQGMQGYQKQHYQSQQSLSFGQWVMCFFVGAIIVLIVVSLDIDGDLAGILAIGLIFAFVFIYGIIKSKITSTNIEKPKEKKKEILPESSDNYSVPVPSGGWRCSRCGKAHYDYECCCSCGKYKSNIINEQLGTEEKDK